MTETAQGTANPAKRKKGRSPSYAGIDLDTAIKRAQTLYERERGVHAIPIALVGKYWGYKAHTTGPASVTYAALIKYGLMTDEGSGDARQATLTPLAVTILKSPDPREREAAIKTAALKPPINAEMWEQYGLDLPTDDTLKWNMSINGPFTATGFDDFIRVYRSTIEFAKLGSEDKADASATDQTEDEPGDDTDKDDQEDKRPAQPPSNPGARVRMSATVQETNVQTYAVPMFNAPPVIIEGHFPLTEDEWAYFMTVLGAMKSGLVGPPAAADE